MKSKERAAYIFGGICLAAILVVLFTKEQLSNDQRAIMRFLIALCSALLSFFFVGNLTLRLKAKGQAISAGTSFAVFVLLYTLVDPMNIKTATATIAPAIVPKSETVARMQETLQEFGEYKGKANGVQDKEVTEAVTKWQNETQRKPNGVIDASDLPAFREYLRSHSSVPQAISDPVLYKRHRVFRNFDGPAGERLKERPADWQNNTALRMPDGKSFDGDIVAAVTAPLDHIGKDSIELGDYAFLVNTVNGKTACAQVGDIGRKQIAMGVNREKAPRPLTFEVSPHLADLIGIDRNFRGVDPSPGQIVCLVFPGSGEPVVVEASQVVSHAMKLYARWGGKRRLDEELNKK